MTDWTRRVAAHFGRATAALRVAAVAVATWAWLAAVATVAVAADPTASPAIGDVRTTPAAPGVVGDPLLALAGVIVVGVLAAGLTFLATRLTAHP